MSLLISIVSASLLTRAPLLESFTYGKHCISNYANEPAIPKLLQTLVLMRFSRSISGFRCSLILSGIPKNSFKLCNTTNEFNHIFVCNFESQPLGHQ